MVRVSTGVEEVGGEGLPETVIGEASRGRHVYLEVSDLWQHIEGHDVLRQTLSDEIYASTSIAEETRRSIKMPNKVWIEPHQLRTHEVRCDWIIGENDLAKVSMSTM